MLYFFGGLLLLYLFMYLIGDDGLEYETNGSSYIFKSSARANGSLVFPATITITPTNVTYTKKMGYFDKTNTITISRRTINSVQVIENFWSAEGCQIIIGTNGNSSIYGQGFTKGNSRKIKEILVG